MGSNFTSIDRGVPIPPAQGGGQPKYPWDDMEVGDSFAYPADKKASGSLCSSHSVNGKIFRRRKMPDGSYRIWMTT